MSNGKRFDKPGIYHIRVKGAPDKKWADWFDGFVITPQPDDETVLVGTVKDQAALHGLLAKIRDLSLPLFTMQRIENEATKT